MLSQCPGDPLNETDGIGCVRVQAWERAHIYRDQPYGHAISNQLQKQLADVSGFHATGRSNIRRGDIGSAASLSIARIAAR